MLKELLHSITCVLIFFFKKYASENYIYIQLSWLLYRLFFSILYTIENAVFTPIPSKVCEYYYSSTE